MDAGTHEALFEASEFVKNIQDRQGFKLACLEEIAFYMGNISKETLYEKGKSMEKNDYGKYLMEIANRKHSEQYWESIDQNPVDRKSTRLNSSHVAISYAVFCLKKKNITLRP